MKRIPYLKKGSKVAIVAPARSVKQDEVIGGIKWLEEQGFIPVYDERLFYKHFIFAGDDASRSAVLQQYLDAEDIEGIWLARGGYGSIRIIDKLDFSKFLQHPKWIVGFSDTTVFHGKLNCMGMPSIHAIMPYSFDRKLRYYRLVNKVIPIKMPNCFDQKTQEAKQSLIDALTGKSIQYEFPTHHLNRQGTAEGEIVGGNLSVFYGMMGSDSFPETDGKILLLEEVDEYIYHIDRMMHALKRAGKLSNLKGLIIGGLTQIKDNADPFGMTVEEVIADAVKDYDYPLCFGFPAGHQADNRALLFGQKAKLEITAEGSVFHSNFVH